MARDELDLDGLAARIQDGDPTAEAELCAQAKRHGEWVFDAITDRLVAGDPNCFSQSIDGMIGDRRQTMMGAELGLGTSVRVLSLDSLCCKDQLFLPALVNVLTELVPPDFRAIPGNARLSAVEREVWMYWLRGHDTEEMTRWILQRDGNPYLPASIRAILRRARQKVWNCREIGWRTALAEDRARGRHAYPPERISAADIMGDDDII
jgi:hypothetical protein